jgi:hypothetical protein
MYVLLLFFFVDFDFIQRDTKREKKKEGKKHTSLSLSLSLSLQKKENAHPHALTEKHTQRSTTAHPSLSKVKATRRIEKTGNTHTLALSSSSSAAAAAALKTNKKWEGK